MAELLHSDRASVPGFRAVPRTGVIYVMDRARELGFRQGAGDWCNLGQGQPETGPLPHAPSRPADVHISADDYEYAPVAGMDGLRRAVAALYNARYRVGKASQYGPENVCICGGGRASLTRVVASLGNVNLGHVLPDYTAYEELLEIFGSFSAIPLLLEPESGYALSTRELRREITGRGLGALLLSNPGNPTGRVVRGRALDAWVREARELKCTLILDEFYSHYLWDEALVAGTTVSAAEFVDDVNSDPVVILDGLTKGWRCPGWRLSWIVGPESVIEAAASAGSFLDGGGNRPLQDAAVSLLEPLRAREEVIAIHEAFARKRRILVDGLRGAGLTVEHEPEGGFYVWASVASLPAPLNDGDAFFEAALREHVITVPGMFFDINPGKRRADHTSRFRQYMRFSFGPDEESVTTAVARIQALVARAR